jgi:hypothetical protein
MSLSQKFRDAVLNSAVRICTLELGKPFPVLHAEHVETKYGLSVILTIREKVDSCVKVIVPHRYSVCFSQEDILAINENGQCYILIYKGLSTMCNAYILQIELELAE